MSSRLGTCSLCLQEALLPAGGCLCPTCAAVIDVPDVPDPDRGDMRKNQEEWSRARAWEGKNELISRRIASHKKEWTRQRLARAQRHARKQKEGPDAP